MTEPLISDFLMMRQAKGIPVAMLKHDEPGLRHVAVTGETMALLCQTESDVIREWWDTMASHLPTDAVLLPQGTPEEIAAEQCRVFTPVIDDSGAQVNAGKLLFASWKWPVIPSGAKIPFVEIG